MTRLAFPFAAAPDGRSMTVDFGDAAHVRQSLELLIMTIPGERVMRPDYGSPIRQMVFNAGNGAVAIALEATLQATITQWLGHALELHDLTVDFMDNEAVLAIAVTYEIRASKTMSSFTLRQDLA